MQINQICKKYFEICEFSSKSIRTDGKSILKSASTQVKVSVLTEKLLETESFEKLRTVQKRCHRYRNLQILSQTLRNKYFATPTP